MGGTLSGGRKAAATNKKKYGEDFYKRIGGIGGKLGKTGGFYADRELARTAGAKGGAKRAAGVNQMQVTKFDGIEIKYLAFVVKNDIETLEKDPDGDQAEELPVALGILKKLEGLRDETKHL